MVHLALLVFMVHLVSLVLPVLLMSLNRSLTTRADLSRLEMEASNLVVVTSEVYVQEGGVLTPRSLKSKTSSSKITWMSTESPKLSFNQLEGLQLRGMSGLAEAQPNRNPGGLVCGCAKVSSNDARCCMVKKRDGGGYAF